MILVCLCVSITGITPKNLNSVVLCASLHVLLSIVPFWNLDYTCLVMYLGVSYSIITLLYLTSTFLWLYVWVCSLCNDSSVTDQSAFVCVFGFPVCVFTGIRFLYLTRIYWYGPLSVSLWCISFKILFLVCYITWFVCPLSCIISGILLSCLTSMSALSYFYKFLPFCLTQFPDSTSDTPYLLSSVFPDDSGEKFVSTCDLLILYVWGFYP